MDLDLDLLRVTSHAPHHPEAVQSTLCHPSLFSIAATDSGLRVCILSQGSFTHITAVAAWVSCRRLTQGIA
jgi:hypothetical protein